MFCVIAPRWHPARPCRTRRPLCAIHDALLPRLMSIFIVAATAGFADIVESSSVNICHFRLFTQLKQ